MKDMNRDYKYGFVTDIETEDFPEGISEEIVELISSKKEEPIFMRDFRLKAFKIWQKMREPKWASFEYDKINYDKYKARRSGLYASILNQKSSKRI